MKLDGAYSKFPQERQIGKTLNTSKTYFKNKSLVLVIIINAENHKKTRIQIIKATLRVKWKLALERHVDRDEVHHLEGSALIKLYNDADKLLLKKLSKTLSWF